MAVFDAGDSVVDAGREVSAELVSAVGADDAGASRAVSYTHLTLPTSDLV